MTNIRSSYGTKRLLVRKSKRSPLSLPGWLSLFGLGTVFFFALIPFAFAWIQDSAEAAAKDALSTANMDWADVSVSGQRVTLEGTAPSTAARKSAETAVLQATRPAMFGFDARPVTVVRNNLKVASATLPAPTPQATPHNLSYVLDRSILVLNGEVPDEATRKTIVDAAQSRLSPPRVTAVSDRLQVTGRTAEPGIVEAALRGVNTLSRCDSGVSAFTNREFTLSCEAQSGRESEISLLANAGLTNGTIGRVDIFTQQAVDTCNETFLDLLSRAKIQFAVSSALIDAASDPLLDRIANAASNCPGRLMIDGHTDNTGRRADNERLSRQRAEAVRRSLIDRGIAGARLRAEGFGSQRPLADNTTAAGRAQNRRIEIKVVSGSE